MSVIELVGVLAFAAVVVVIVAVELVRWARSRGRRSRSDDDVGEDVPKPDSGYWGEAESGFDSGAG